MTIRENQQYVIIEPMPLIGRVFLALFIQVCIGAVVVAGLWLAINNDSLAVRVLSGIGVVAIALLDIFFCRMRVLYKAIIDTASNMVSFDERSPFGVGRTVETLPISVIETIMVRLVFYPGDDGARAAFLFAPSFKLNDGREKHLGQIPDLYAQKKLELIKQYIPVPFGFVATEGIRKLLVKYKKPYADLFSPS